MTNLPLTRRTALGLGTAAVAGFGVWSESRAQESTSPNEKLNIACVGTANRAAANIAGCKSENIVALCDIDEGYLNRAAGQYQGARKYVDYRKMLDKEAAGIDAVIVGTPDHLHAPAGLAAMDLGKHLYCEKPLTHTVAEARQMAELAAKNKLATQMGTQIHAGDNYRRVVEIVQSGAIGDVDEVHVWVGKGWGGGTRPEKSDPVPKSLHWDLWLGPAPERPFVNRLYHPANWRRWWDFGGGTLADMACHYMDLPFWALDLGSPTTVAAEGPEVHPETCPLGLKVFYEFPARKPGQPAVKLTWYDGQQTPKEVAGIGVPGAGVMFLGSKGKMFANYGSYRLYPEEQFQDFQPPEQTIPRSIGHHAEWVKACKEGTPTTCHFGYSGRLTEAVLLGNVAYRLGRKLEWNAAELQVTNVPEAAPLIDKPYREGWELAGVLTG